MPSFLFYFSSFLYLLILYYTILYYSLFTINPPPPPIYLLPSAVKRNETKVISTYRARKMTSTLRLKQATDDGCSTHRAESTHTYQLASDVIIIITHLLEIIIDAIRRNKLTVYLCDPYKRYTYMCTTIIVRAELSCPPSSSSSLLASQPASKQRGSGGYLSRPTGAEITPAPPPRFW